MFICLKKGETISSLLKHTTLWPSGLARAQNAKALVNEWEF